MTPVVHVHAADVGGCGYNRMIWPGTALQHAGFPVTVFQPAGGIEGVWQVRWERDVHGVEHPHSFERRPQCDVVVLQRPLTRLRAELVPVLQAEGIRVVVEVDDDFEHIDRRNKAYADADPVASPDRNWKHLAMACDQADLVTVTTPRLANVYGRHGRVRIIPNYVPEWYLAVDHPPHDGPPVVGWSGSLDSHPTDLLEVGHVVGELVRKDIVQFRCVGSGMGVADQLNLDSRYDREDRSAWAAGWVPLEDYPAEMAKIDIGLVPLALSPFNEAKSALKGLEFAATGASFVASGTGPYQQVVAKLLGRVARTQRMWTGAIKALAADWREYGEQARSWIKEQDWTYEAQAGQWLSAWTWAAKGPGREP